MAGPASLKLSLVAGLLALCLLWMDACLYFQIQSIDETSEAPGAAGPARNQKNPPNKPSFNLPLDQLGPDRHRVAPVPLMDKFSFAFRGMSVKLMMTDPVDNYLLAPLSEAFAELINLRDNLTFITANMVSYAGVVSALIAAKLVTYDSLALHRMSYVMFQVRTWLDDLDGTVARARMGINKHVSLKNTSGYFVDGVCDAIGFVAYVIGCYVFLRGTLRRRRSRRNYPTGGPRDRRNYSLQSITEIETGHTLDGLSPEEYIPLECNASPGGPPLKTDQFVTNDIYDEEFDESRSYEEDFELTHSDADDDDDRAAILHCDTLSQVEIRPAHEKTDKLQEDAAPEKGTRKLSSFANNLTKQILPETSRILWRKAKTRSGNLVLYRYIKDKLNRNPNNRHLVLLVSCFLLQLAMCSMFWNRYILVYQDLLESAAANDLQLKVKRRLLKSNLMYMIIWFWRLTNGHSFMQMLITAVFFGKLWQFLDFIKYVGFIEITLLALVTELHLIDVRNFVDIV